MSVRIAGGGRRWTASAVALLGLLTVVAFGFVAASPADAASKKVRVKCKVGRGSATCLIPAGPAGPRGAVGAKGETGPAGPQGEVGPQGPVGRDGRDGAAGPAGLNGLNGRDGAQGIQGDKGATGDQGIQGIQGDKGDKGDKGDQGIQGDAGSTGPQGEKGDTGATGPAGTTLAGKGAWDETVTYRKDEFVSFDGASYVSNADDNTANSPDSSDQWTLLAQKGDTGPAGNTLTGMGEWDETVAYARDEFVSYGGASYVSTEDDNTANDPSLGGPWTLLADKGADGANGADGTNGIDGAQGEQGIQGLKGERGPAGATGPRGLVGPKGDQGDVGPVGPSGVANSVLVQDTGTGSATVTCPAEHPRVYSGGASSSASSLAETRPTDGLDGWSASASDTEADITVYAVCGDE